MCTKFLNANVALFKDYTKEGENISGFNGPFERIIAENSNGKLCIKDFNIVTFINLMGSSKNKKLIKENQTESLEETIRKVGCEWVPNILDERKTLEIKIRITKCSEIAYERATVDIDAFTINTAESVIFENACVPFLNYKQVTHIDTLTLDINNPKGNYVVKVLTRTQGEEKYTVQAIEYFVVE